jgi:hypothetical protein
MPNTNKTANKPATKTTTRSATEPAIKTSGKTAAKAPAAKPVLKKAVAIKSPAPKVKATKADAPVASADTAKPSPAKPKLVRDSFTMPRSDFALIDLLKERALGFKRATKKSELLRAGLHALISLSDTQLQAALESLTPLKSGRPTKTAK